MDLQEVGCVKVSVIFFPPQWRCKARQMWQANIHPPPHLVYLYVYSYSWAIGPCAFSFIGEKKWISALPRGDWQRKIAVPKWQKTGSVLVLNHCIDIGNERRNSSSDSQKWLYPSLWALSGLLVLLLIHLAMMLKCLDSCLREQKRNTDDMVIYYDSLALRLSELHACANRAAFWPDSKVCKHLIKSSLISAWQRSFVLRKINLEERCYFERAKCFVKNKFICRKSMNGAEN